MGPGHGCSDFQTGGVTGGINDQKYAATCVFLAGSQWYNEILHKDFRVI
jgi:hypothetical protein